MENVMNGVQEKQVRIWNKLFIGVFIANLSMNLSQQLVNPLISRYVSHIGGSPAVIGLVSSSFAIIALLCKFVSGPAIDSFNKKYVLLGALAVIAVAFFGYSMSMTVPAMFAFRMTQGLGQAFTSTVFMVIVTQTLPADRLGTGMGVFAMAQSACLAMGPAMGLQVAEWFGYRAAFAFGACLMVVAVVIVSFVKVKSEPAKKFQIKPGNIVAKEAVIPAALMGLLYLAFSSINAFLIVYADGKNILGNVGLYSTAYALTLLVSRPLVGRLIDKFGFVKVVIVNITMCIITFFIFSVANNLITLIVAGVIMGFGFGACQPAIQALTMKSVKPEKRGAGSSTNYIGMDLGSLFGASVAGVVAQQFGYVSMWKIMTIPFFVAMILVLISASKINTIEREFATDNN